MLQSPVKSSKKTAIHFCVIISHTSVTADIKTIKTGIIFKQQQQELRLTAKKKFRTAV